MTEGEKSSLKQKQKGYQNHSISIYHLLCSIVFQKTSSCCQKKKRFVLAILTLLVILFNLKNLRQLLQGERGRTPSKSADWRGGFGKGVLSCTESTWGVGKLLLSGESWANLKLGYGGGGSPCGSFPPQSFLCLRKITQIRYT